MKQVGSILWPKFRVLQVYGANTGVGKTIFSSVLCRAFQKRLPNVHYLKPVSTGPLSDADDHHIASFGTGIKSKCLFQFDEPVSPHIAVRSAPQVVTDAALLEAVHNELRSYATGEEGISIVETAGGVLSPSPSGSSQADLYRPLRLPILLIGDHNLGGIGTTISAWESLRLRGYDIDHVALFSEDRYDNHTYLKEYFSDRQVGAFSIPPPPERSEWAHEDVKAMLTYYEESSENSNVQKFIAKFIAQHDERIRKIRAMPGEAEKAIWHPFLQHTERSRDTIAAWDSAYGDFFQSYTTKQEIAPRDSATASETALLKPAFDGSASWWTQGLGHGNPRLALTAAHAAGRFGHVMFGGAIHEPALQLAQTLIAQSGNPRLSKVFYSDNGSTGMEVAVKMALRASVMRYLGPQKATHRDVDIRILGLKNSYHGDTIGTMDCSEPSIYNEKVEWYKGRGVWLDFPTVEMRKGQWQVKPFQAEAATVPSETKYFETIRDVFDFGQRQAEYEQYRQYIQAQLSEYTEKHGVSFGALIIEPMLLGAGGMMFADPLYQKCLVEVAREYHDDRSWLRKQASELAERVGFSEDLNWRGMPVIFDEVFTGLYRLGRFSAASFLGVQPDIVVNAKLLTGGLLPLCTTTASEAIFEAFLSHDKTDALLHGHSYTAHPVGCSVANESLKTLTSLDKDGAWDNFKEDWSSHASSPAVSYQRSEHAWSMWSTSFLESASHKTSIDHVFAIGSVLAMSLRDPNGSGYASTAATGLRDKLLAGAGDDAVIHCRVLGNVLYLMAALTTPEQTLAEVEDEVLAALE